MFEPTRSGPHEHDGIDEAAWHEARRWTYRLLGWDLETGMPSETKVVELGLEWLLPEIGSSQVLTTM